MAIYLRTRLFDAKQERDQYKAAWEWARKYGEQFANSYERHVNHEGTGLSELRAILAQNDSP